MDSDSSDSGISDGYDSDNDGRFGEAFVFPYNGSSRYVFEREFAKTLRNEWLIFSKTETPFYTIYKHQVGDNKFKIIISQTLATLRFVDCYVGGAFEYMNFYYEDWKILNEQFQKLYTSLDSGEESYDYAYITYILSRLGPHFGVFVVEEGSAILSTLKSNTAVT